MKSGPSNFLAASITGTDLPSTPVDWPALLQFADYHRLTPILARATRSYPKPDEAAAALMAAARTNAQQNLLLFSHTVKIAAAFRARGIEALTLKGPVLADQLYGDLSMRVCSDVDLLVRAEQFAAAASTLAELGYVTDAMIDEAALRAHLRFQHDLAFAHADGTLVELHADIAQPHYSYRADLDRWFEHAQTLSVGGHTIRTLSLEHALVLAIVHGTKHLWTRLDLLADVAAIAHKPIDWNEVRAQIARIGARRGAAVAGYLLQDVLHLQTPLLAHDPAARRIALKTRDRLLRQMDPTYWQSRVFDLAVRERTGDRLRYAASLYRKWSAR